MDGRSIAARFRAVFGQRENAHETRSAMEHDARPVHPRQEEIGQLKAAASEAHQKAAQADALRAEQTREKESIERLAMAQAAEIKNISDGLAHLRGQLTREAEEGRLLLQEKDNLERRLEIQKKESELTARELKRKIAQFEARPGAGPAPEAP